MLMPSNLLWLNKRYQLMNITTFAQKLIILLGATLTTSWLCSGLLPAQAEGSKELTSSGGRRAYLTYTTAGNYFGVLERTTIYVYADTGEKINLGSSAHGLNNGQIQYTKPDGSIGTCDTSSTNGRIVDRTQELNGPFPNTGGYTPCTISVANGESGIWKIDFVSPNPGLYAVSGVNFPGAPPPIGATANWSPQTAADWFVTAWDVTVTSGNFAKSGRAYTNYFASNIGDYLADSFSGVFYVITRDGYHYRIDANGLDPFRFIFFSDNRGVYNTTTNKPSYRSFDLNLPSGFAIRDPNALETSDSYINKLFFNPIDPALPSSSALAGSVSTWLNPSLAPPPPPTILSLIGSEGTPNQIGQSIGGYFNFHNPDSINRPYQINLDLNANNIFGDGNDRVLQGTASPGNNVILWDGKDGNGVVMKSQIITFKAIIAILGGEVHFPLLDAEGNSNGLIIQRLNGPTNGSFATPSFNTDRIYYNDAQVLGNGGAGGSSAIPPVPANASSGVNSAAGAHRWGTDNAAGFGNAAILDTWTYAPEFSTTILNIVVKSADLQISKNLLGSLTKGQTTTYTIDVTNANTPAIGSISNVVGATVQDILLPIFTNPQVVSCQVISGTGDCGTYGFTGNTFNAKVNLDSGAKLRFEIQATLSSAATGTITNSVTVNRPNDIGDPVDQDGQGGTTNLSETATVSNSIAATSGNAQVVLVKRITAINGNRIENSNDGTKLNSIVHDLANSNDIHPNWPSNNYLIGAINGGKVKSGDTIEYTIYFLNSGKLDARGVRICDLITANQSFQTAAYGVGKDLQAQIGLAPIMDLTANNDLIDRTQFYAPNAAVPNACKLKAANNNGTVDIPITGVAGTGLPDLTVVPGSIFAGTPSNSYGLVRFSTRVP
jgi:uncharacterized repeat protein (TIGR01451 family)